jgi:hypothetical protein
MWSSIVGALLSKVAPKVADYYMQKEQLKADIELEKLRGKAAYEAAKTARAEASEGRDHEWELESIRNSGFKDEFVLIVLSIPMILSFIPYTQPFVVAGFTALDGTPLWYRTTVASIYLATFGLRLWRRDVNKGTNVVEMIK